MMVKEADHEQEETVRLFTVTESSAGERLDVFLSHSCPDLSRNQIQNAIKADRADVDGKSRPKGYRLTTGNQISFQPLPEVPLRVVPEDLPLDIVYEDEFFLVVNKAPGMVVHPGPGHLSGTLVNALLHHCQQLRESPDRLRPGIVHRLDLDTSGLLAVALTDMAHRELAAQLKSRQMGRVYQALSWGTWRKPKDVLEGKVGRHPRDRQRMAVVALGGRPAVTRYQVMEDYGFVQLCRVELATGRTHQIRVHFARAGHPVVGDALYGDDKRARNVRPVDRPLAARMIAQVRRQMLHASELTLTHPDSGRILTFAAAIPSDMVRVLSELRSTLADPGLDSDR
jgi:23S rRNA pseudouridine1911/1915/1917 synthase